MTSRRLGAIGVHFIAAMGVVFWIVTFVSAAMGDIDAPLVLVGLLALVLGGAHVLISITTTRGSAAALWLTVFVFISDSLLGVFVDPMAFLLSGFTVVLFVAVLLSRKIP